MANEMEELRGNVKILREDVDEALKTIAHMANDISAIKNVLIGNPLDKNDKGFLGYKETINELVRFKERSIYVMIGLSIGAGFGLEKMIHFLIK